MRNAQTQSTANRTGGARGNAGRTRLFVDADNHGHALAQPLMEFLTSMGRDVTEAVIAGNHNGECVGAWGERLRELAPGALIQGHVVPCRKQAADVMLMFELAQVHRQLPEPNQLIVIVSRDALLVEAAVRMRESGHHVIVAMNRGAPPMPVDTVVPVVALAIGSGKAVKPSHATMPPPADCEVSDELVAAIARIRHELKPTQSGAYDGSAIGQVLRRMGHDKAARKRIVAAIPNVQVLGGGANKRYVF